MVTVRALILLLLVALAQSAPKLNVVSISDNSQNTRRPIFSSINGGKKIYIKVNNHHDDINKNKVAVGTYPCRVIGVEDNFILCETTACTLNADKEKPLNVTVISNGQTVITKHPDTVTYAATATPNLTAVYPTSSHAEQQVAVAGSHRTSDLGSGEDNGDTSLSFGKNVCVRNNVTQSPITGNKDSEKIICKQSQDNQAGNYKISEDNINYGSSVSQTLKRPTLKKDQDFHYTTLPAIKNVTNQGSDDGQWIQIKGSGFARNPNNNSIFVDGQKCQVKQSTPQFIKCKLQKKDANVTSKLVTNSTSSTQISGYRSGVGLNYTRYINQTYGDIFRFVNASRESQLPKPVETSIKTDIVSREIEARSGQIWKGYFTAPVNGTYTFRGLAQYSFAMYFSQVHGSAELPEEPLIYSNQAQTNWDDLFFNHTKTAVASVELIQNCSYYVEVYHLAFGFSGGRLKIYMEVPNNNTNLAFQAYQVDQIILNATVQPEIMTYSMLGGTGGMFKIGITRTDPKNFAVTFNGSANVTYGCTQKQFETILKNNFDCFYKYLPFTVNRTIYDSAGKVLNDLKNAAKITYEVSFYKLRSSACQTQKFMVVNYDYKGKFISNQTKKHSPLIKGTFGLKIGGVIFNKGKIAYNVTARALQSYFNEIKGFESVYVTYISDYGCQYSCKWIISYRGYYKPIPEIVLSTVDLEGGTIRPVLLRSSPRKYEAKIIFEPIDYRFLSFVSSLPNVQVKVNQIPAVCLTNCSYQFIKMFKIISLILNESKLHIQLLNLTDLTKLKFLDDLKLEGIKIQAKGISCLIIANQTNISALFIVCQLPTNYDGSPCLPAGNITFLVFIPTIGYIGSDDGQTSIQIPFFADQLRITNGSINGGYSNSIIGSGFAAENQSITTLNIQTIIPNLEVTICNNPVQITFISNQRIDFIHPPCLTPGTYQLSITFGNFTYAELTFNYTDPNAGSPIIASITPSSSNPMIKSTLCINGANFGTNISAVNVYLTNSSGRAYQLKVISVNNTVIKCGLSGGLPNNYTVQVNYPDSNGNAMPATPEADEFIYVSQIEYVYPNTGSYFGGTLLTIVGKNFSPAQADSLAYIGYTLNWFCKIQKINDTVIQCLTPPISSDYAPGEQLEVIVSTKLTYFSDCTSNNCSFSYINATDSPEVTNITIQFDNQSVVVEVRGSGFNSSTQKCDLRFRSQSTGSVTNLPAQNCYDDMANLTLSDSLSAGKYFVSFVNQMGQSNPKQLQIKWIIGSLLLQRGSTEGSYNYISGGLFYPASFDNGFKIQIIASTILPQQAKVLECCSNNEVKLYFPPAPTGTIFKLIFYSPAVQAIINYTVNYNTTPYLDITSPLNLTLNPGQVEFTFNTSVNFACIPNNITFQSIINSSDVVIISNWTNNNGSSNFSVALPSGSYRLKVNSSYGYFYNRKIINVKANPITSQSQNLSFAGGRYIIYGQSVSPSSYLLINGYKANIIEYQTTQATYQIPALLTVDTQRQFSLAVPDLIDLASYDKFSDQNASTANGYSFDGIISTEYYSNNSKCWIGVDFGSFFEANISRIRFFPNNDWNQASSYLLDAQFQGSNDQANWTTICKIDSTVHTAWNTILPKTSTPFRFIRFQHNSTSQCSLAEIQLFGLVYSTKNSSLIEQPMDVVYSDGFNSFTLSSVINFKSDFTPIISLVYPSYGDIFGGYNLKLTGQNLGFTQNVSINIDGIPCQFISGNDTQIVCLVGARPYIPKKNTFTVILGNSKAIIHAQFLYVLAWSDDRTWGVDLPPIQNDLVYVPAGMTLLVDQSTPKLAGIAVQNGTIIFANNTNITVSTDFITVVGGRFIAGTQKQPLNSNLTFILYGSYHDTQLPIAGNKMIFCLQCKISMYGKPRTTWTTLDQTIFANDLTFTVKQDVDWKIGQQVVIASTSFDHTQAEVRTISQINGRNITVDSPFKHNHVSVQQVYDSGDQFTMQAEVALLNRNIKVTGDPTSKISNYGAYLMLYGKALNGFQAKIAYTEFTLCGQPQIPGRNCIYFNLNGQAPSSFAKGNLVHQSYSRVVAVHASHFITVQNNVGYRAAGHNFLLQDGIQTYNLIQNNLAISSLSVTTMMQSDIMVSSFYIRHPTNYFIGNRAAGSDFYGFNFDLPKTPTGSSASKDVCPTGSSLGSFANNVAHSNKYHGLRIKTYFARLHPCSSWRNDRLADNPWEQNPSVAIVMENFTSYKNMKRGVVAEETGNLILNNFRVAQNYIAGIEIYQANFTKEYVQINNSIIVGQFYNNTDKASKLYGNILGLITPRSGSTNISNVHFYNFPNGSSAFVTCSQCDNYLYFTNIGTEIFVSGLEFFGITGRYLKMLGKKNDIIYDNDGSFSSYFNGTNSTQGTLVYAYDHIFANNSKNCFPLFNTSQWDNFTFCDNQTLIRRIMFTNAIGIYNFFFRSMAFAPITKDTANSASSSVVTWTSSQMGSYQPKIQKSYTWSLPFVLGNKYLVWWSGNVDFNHLSISTTSLYGQDEPGVVFKFTYSTSRQLYQIGPMRGGVFPSAALLKIPTKNYLDVDSCLNGDYYHNDSLRTLEICQSGKNKTAFQYTEINAVYCRNYCPVYVYPPYVPPPPTPPTPPPVVLLPPCHPSFKQNFIRMWSNASQWPSRSVPRSGQSVTISCNWTILLDINPQPILYFTIDGKVIANDAFDINITVKAIHIRSGKLIVGTDGSPYLHKFIIQINGYRDDGLQYIDPIVMGSKFFVITGELALYGSKPDTQITYLTKTAYNGSTVIWVNSSEGWQIGDQIALSPSFANPHQYETVTITDFASTGAITIDPPLNYTHYGAAQLTINNTYGSLDARTRVGHLTRSIKIVSGGDATWGFAIYVYGYKSDQVRIGKAIFDGVQFQSGGQEQINPTLRFLNLHSASTSVVTGSSFYNCLSSCISVENSNDIEISSNVLYNIIGKGIQVINSQKFTVSKNLFTGVTTGNIQGACFATYKYPEDISSVQVQNNFCLGSEMYGFIFPHIKCEDIQSNKFSNNTAGSCKVGFLFNSISEKCQAFSYISAYACSIGQTANPPDTNTLMFSNFILADNQLGATLRFGNSDQTYDNTAYFQNSYISALSRPNCSQCYQNSTYCKDTSGLRMLTVTINGKTVDDNMGTQFDTVDQQELIDGKAFLTNITFNNFRQEYQDANYSSTIFENCGNNFAMKPHPQAVNMVAGHYLFTSTCENCDNSSFIYCDPNNQKYLGLKGGCGDILCTGMSNYILIDWNGTFFGETGTILPNNTAMGNEEPNCTLYSQMNSHFCSRQDFVVLEYQSKAPDFNSRIMWPVNLTANTSNYTTITNGWREWNWQNGEPLGTRLGRFLSIVKLYNVYNMTFTSMPPLELHLQLQKRTPLGNNSHWTMVKLRYPLPNSIQVRVGGEVLAPIIMTNTDGTGLRRPINKSKCGDNIFFFSNKTIQLVLTEDPNCVVVISLSDSIQLTTHFAMNASDFFSDTVMSSFISNLCALLNIQDQSRVKVVGVYAGSAIVDVYIAPVGTGQAVAGADPNQQVIAGILAKAISDGTFASAMYTAIGYQVIQASSTLWVLPTTTTNTTQTSQLSNNAGQATADLSSPTLIIGIIVGVVVVILAVIFLMCYIYRRHMAAKDEIANLDDEKQVKEKEHIQVMDIGMSDTVLFAVESQESPTRNPTPAKKKKNNVRRRQRQTLQLIEFD